MLIIKEEGAHNQGGACYQGREGGKGQRGAALNANVVSDGQVGGQNGLFQKYQKRLQLIF